MSLFNPIWRVTIGGVEYQTAILANLTITSGRTNIYEQAQAGYTNLEIINLDQSNVTIGINDAITIELQDSTATFVPIFGGSVVEVGISVAAVGSVDYAQRINIIALGALARLPKALTDGVLSDDFDGDQIFTILSEVLFAQWQAVPAALTWATYDPTTQWQDAENSGLGEIDRPGNYELENRGSSVTDVYSLVSALATSGLGYIGENAQGQIFYADSTHRTNYLAANGYVELNSQSRSGTRFEHPKHAPAMCATTLLFKYGDNSAREETSPTDPVAIGRTLRPIVTDLSDHAQGTLADARGPGRFLFGAASLPTV
jgi:hypothetical protein